MALATKKSRPIFEKTGSSSKRLSDNKISEISSSFANNVHVNFPESSEAPQALMYIIQEMQEDIEELRRYVTNEATGSAVKSILAVNVSDLPNRSVGLSSGQLYVHKNVITVVP
mgnify:CR=1 FL=1